MRSTWPAVAFFAAAALGPVVVRDAFFLDGLVLILLWGATGAAWNVAGGYAGQVSLGHAAFFGLGAYSAALLGTKWGVSPWIGLLVGAALATAFGFILGFLSNRLRGPYFVLATIAFSQVLLIVASRWRGFTSGSEGIPVPFRPGFWTLGMVDKRVWVYLVLVLATLLYLVELYLERSRRGYQLAAVREDEDAALSLGVPARRLKVAAIAVSAALTAMCGTLWTQYVGFVDPLYVFSVDLSVRFCLFAILGGIGTPLGPFLGATLITILETSLRARFGGIGAGLVGIYLIIYGAVLIGTMRVAPQGLLPWVGALLRRRPHLGPTPLASCRSRASPSASAASPRIATSPSKWPPASWSASSARTGRASPPSSRSSAASTAPTPGRCAWTVPRSPGSRRIGCAAWAWRARSRSCGRSPA